MVVILIAKIPLSFCVYCKIILYENRMNTQMLFEIRIVYTYEKE